MTTPNFIIPEIQASQSQKHVTANEAFHVIDYAMDRTVEDSYRSKPPALPAEGQKHIVSSTATLGWAGQDNKIACYSDATWIFFEPKEGWEFYDLQLQRMLRYNGSTWEEAVPSGFLSIGGNEGGTKLVTTSELLSGLSGATVSSTIAFPNESLILSATLRVVTAITGATSFDYGDAGTPARFGSSIDVADGTTNQGTIAPAVNTASTPVQLTANGGSFTGGDVRVQIHYLEFVPPTS